MSSKIVSQIFKILFQTGDINIFVLRGVFVSRYVQSRLLEGLANILSISLTFLVQLKSSKKPSAVKSETHFSREAIEN